MRTQKKKRIILTNTPAVTYEKAEVSLPVLTASQFADPVNISLLKSTVKTVVDTESPICIELLTNRLCEACGIKRKTPGIKDRVEYLIKDLKYPVTLQNNTPEKSSDADVKFIWKTPGTAWKIAEQYRTGGDRDADMVPVEEAACAAVYLTRSQFGMPREALITETGKALGFKTSTPTVKRLCDSAITYALELGALIQDGEDIKGSEVENDV